MPEITLIGTGGMLPLPDRWLTSCYYFHKGHAVLIDCGEGTQIALTEAACRHNRIDVILLTHLHADHVAGLPGLLLSMGNGGRREPVTVFLPEGRSGVLAGLLNICGGLPFELRVGELPNDRECSFVLDDIDPLLTVSSLPLDHSERCLGYSLSLGRLPEFMPERAKELGVPVKYWKALHAGGSVTLEDGRTVTTEQVTLRERPPIKLTYCTDSLPIDGIVGFAQGSDLFICEGMYGDADKKEDMDKKHHMLMQDACRLAKSAEVKQLWLTHYSPACSAPWLYEEELKKLFREVTCARDGMKILLNGE